MGVEEGCVPFLASKTDSQLNLSDWWHFQGLHHEVKASHYFLACHSILFVVTQEYQKTTKICWLHTVVVKTNRRRLKWCKSRKLFLLCIVGIRWTSPGRTQRWRHVTRVAAWQWWGTADSYLSFHSLGSFNNVKVYGKGLLYSEYSVCTIFIEE